jgi:hypothetical protein
MPAIHILASRQDIEAVADWDFFRLITGRLRDIWLRLGGSERSRLNVNLPAFAALACTISGVRLPAMFFPCLPDLFPRQIGQILNLVGQQCLQLVASWFRN